MRQASQERKATAAVGRRLRERRSEIEQATMLRVHAVSAMPRAGGPAYVEGLRAAVVAGIDYGLEGIERGEQAAPPIPDALLAQARLAARSRVGLDTVLRRYFAGHTLLGDFVVEEAGRAEALGPAELKRLLRSQAVIVDRLLAAVSAAYAEEAERCQKKSSERRRVEWIERMLAGEPLPGADLGYDFDGWHLGLVASRADAAQLLSSLSRILDARLLTVRREDGELWAWLGRREPLAVEDALRLAEEIRPATLALALGEPGEGISGWRRSHRQAAAALLVARGQANPVVRYGDVALLVAVLRDDLLAESLRRLYLEPLRSERDGGAVLRETLRAFLDANGSLSAAAAALSVNRRTVSSRLIRIEEKVGRALGAVLAEVEIALRLDEFESVDTCQVAIHAPQTGAELAGQQ